MKRFLTIFMLVCLMFLLIGVTSQAQESTNPPNIMFVGIIESIDTDLGNSTSVTAGYGLPYAQDSRFWFLPNFKIGSGGSPSNVSPETAFMITRSDKFYSALLLGPNFDIQQIDPEAPTVTYLTAASGLMLAYDLNTQVGLWTYGKYKTQFGIESAYKNGFDIGIGIHFRIKT